MPVFAIIGGCLSLGSGFSPAHPRLNQDTYQLIEGNHRSVRGCTFDYRVFEPLQPLSPATVMLGHGFLRNQDRLVALSRALANAGIRAVTLNFCNMRPWNGYHEVNARDMRQLAEALDRSEDIIFGGFSAGALAAVLAADAGTRALFVLDFVDQADRGKQALATLDIPIIGLHGPSSACNAQNQGKQAISQYLLDHGSDTDNYQLVADASHCEFESPSNWLCEITCADDDSVQQNQQTREQIIEQSIQILKTHLVPPS